MVVAALKKETVLAGAFSVIVILQTFRFVSLESDDVTLCVVSGAVDIAAGVEAARPEAAQGEGSLPMGLVTPHLHFIVI